MTSIDANGVDLCIESFGADDAPLVLLADGTTMLFWPGALCERLAAGKRRVLRYGLRQRRVDRDWSGGVRVHFARSRR